MGSIHGTRCKCGYKSSVTVGGGRNDFLNDSKFPFYCKKCGLISINIRAKVFKCPQCNSEDISPYGQPPISEKIESDLHPAIQCNDYVAYRHGNLCPKCKEFTMRFGPTEIFFD